MNRERAHENATLANIAFEYNVFNSKNNKNNKKTAT